MENMCICHCMGSELVHFSHETLKRYTDGALGKRHPNA